MWPACGKEQLDVTRSTLCIKVNKEKKSAIHMEATDVSVYVLIFLLICFQTQTDPTPQVSTCQV